MDNLLGEVKFMALEGIPKWDETYQRIVGIVLISVFVLLSGVGLLQVLISITRC